MVILARFRGCRLFPGTGNFPLPRARRALKDNVILNVRPIPRMGKISRKRNPYGKQNLGKGGRVERIN
jgi:hypothetical protein